MKYEEFRKKISSIEREVLDLIFVDLNKQFYEDRFDSCYALAEKLVDVDEVNIEQVVKSFKIIPSSYAGAVLFLVNKIDDKKLPFTKHIALELKKIYKEDYLKAIAKKKNKFAFFDKSTVDNLQNLKLRLVDSTEIIKIAKLLKVNANDVIGDYKGKDENTIQLSKAMKRIRQNAVKTEFKEVEEKIVISSLKKANNALKIISVSSTI